MKVGIITFHWAANYGAVLQTYALQKAIEKLGVDVEIIDYFPKNYKRSLLDCLLSRNIKSAKTKYIAYVKGKRIDKIIQRKLRLSKRYKTSRQLNDNPPVYDVYVSGSDQIWNPFFTLKGEGQPTLSYFLDFVPENSRRVSYATSIGTADLNEEYWRLVLPELKKYDAISVRETGAANLIKERGFNAKVVPDPTLLIEKTDYNEVFAMKQIGFSYYILQENQNVASRIKNAISREYASIDTIDLNGVSLDAWGGYIAGSKEVLTNSYHGVIFSILYQKNFYVVPIEGELEGMNDRIYTLLQRLGMMDRIINTYEDVLKLRDKQIEWEKIFASLESYRMEGKKFLQSIFDEA